MCAIIIARLVICNREAKTIMKVKKCFKNGLKRAFLRYLFAFILVITGVFGVGFGAFNGDDVYAEPDITTPTAIDPNGGGTTGNGANVNTTDGLTNTTGDGATNSTTVDAGTTTTDSSTTTNVTTNDTTNTSTADTTGGGADECQNSLGAIGWLVCPTTGKIAEAVDWLYEKIESILVINPIEAKDGSPIYEIWKYCRGITNIVFIIFLLVVIYSQITGYGISNYGLKKALPKLIVAAVLVNLSFLICQLGVDLSNVIGSSLRGVFTAVQETAIASMEITPEAAESMNLMYSELYGVLAGGSLLAIGATMISFETGAIWMLIPIVLGAIVAVASGLITIALRQAVVSLLVMIAPLAIVANILPNTENLFKKWKKLLIQMLVFYPMFSLLFGASSLAGFAIIASAKDAFWLILGLAVQVFPLFFSWSLMKMSGTVLGTINTKIRGFAARPLASNRAWADSRRQLTKQKMLASNSRMPSVRLMQFMSNRRIAREEEMSEYATTVKNRALAYNASKHYKKDGSASRDGMKAYKMQAENMRYAEVIERDKNNMNKGLGVLAAQPKSAAMRARLKQLDVENVTASDRLKIEKARGEIIEYENAVGFHKRMEDAVNSHFDNIHRNDVDKNGKSIYRVHNIKDREAAEQRYDVARNIMEGSLNNIQYAAATAATSYDTQKKIMETKMNKYFELTPPTRDVEYRLGELTTAKNAADNIDSIVAGLRILNQRGDTDLMRKQLENVLNSENGVRLGTHASQSLASFLMFEVKDNDPFLRRFGKYINLETAKVYNKNDRQNDKFSLNEYITGEYDDWEPISPSDNPSAPRRPRVGKSKRAMAKLMEGTSLDNVERTAYSNLDEMLTNAYTKDGKLDVDAYLKKRNEIETAIGPAFISASLKYLSGSEQLQNAVTFLTGYSGSKARWEDKEDPLYGSEEAEEYFRRKTLKYLKDQTPTQILGIRSDYRDALMEHLSEEYFKENPEEREKFNDAVADIQTRYGDKDKEKAKEMRDADIKKLRAKKAGAQMRKILGETGKLEQIYRTRRSGAANNAKDWLREWINLDDEITINSYLENADKQKRKEFRASSSVDSDKGENIVAGGFDKADRAYFANRVRSIYESWRDFGDGKFYEESTEWVKKNLDGVSEMIVKKYEEYHEANPNADDYDLMEYLQKLLLNPDNY